MATGSATSIPSAVPLPLALVADTVNTVCGTLGIREELRDAMLIPMRATTTAPLHAFSHITPEQITDVVARMRLVYGEGMDPEPLSIIDSGLVRSFFVWCVNAPGALAASQAQAQPPPQVIPPLPPSMIKHQLIISQLDDRSSKPMDPATHNTLIDRYRAVYGPEAEIPLGEEPSANQLVCLQTLLDEGVVPYVDLSIFTAYADRKVKQLKFMGSVFQADGTIGPKEIFGPPDVHAWEEGWKVYQNAMLMPNAADLGVPERYRKKIVKLNADYPGTWALLYQTDTRARSELFGRKFLKALAHQQQAEAAGHANTTGFRKDRPWQHIFQLVLDDASFWNEEYKEEAFRMVAKLVSMDALLDGDARVGSAHVLDTQPARRSQGSGRRRSRTPPPPPQRPRGPARTPKAPKFQGDLSEISNGRFVRNKKGIQICVGFQTGNCGPGRCPNDHAHQCAFCLSTHGAEYPSSCNRTPGKGGGKGFKGKGGNRGGEFQGNRKR